MVGDGEPVLPADERESRTELREDVPRRSVKACSSARSVHRSVMRSRTSKIRVPDDFLGLVGVDRVHAMGRSCWARPRTGVQPVTTWCSSTGRDQPSRASWSAYQPRSAGSLTWSNSAQACPHSNFPTTLGNWVPARPRSGEGPACTTGRWGQARHVLELPAQAGRQPFDHAMSFRSDPGDAVRR